MTEFRLLNDLHFYLAALLVSLSLFTNWVHIYVNILILSVRWTEAANDAWSSDSTSPTPTSSASSNDAPSFPARPDTSRCCSAHPAHDCCSSGENSKKKTVLMDIHPGEKPLCLGHISPCQSVHNIAVISSALVASIKRNHTGVNLTCLLSKLMVNLTCLLSKWMVIIFPR